MRTYKIADLTVHMDSFGRAQAQAEVYRTEDSEVADIVICSNAKTLMAQNPHLTEDDCEYLSTGASFYRQLVGYNGMMLHASAVVLDGKAYLFTAPSGTGKSTHVQRWLQLFGDRAFVLNDDKPALRIVDGKVFAYGTPWSGKHDYSCNARAELGGIAVVKRSDENSMRLLDPTEGIFALLNQTARSIAPELMQNCMDTIQAIVSTGKLYELSCNMDITAAKLSYETMSGKRFTE